LSLPISIAILNCYVVIVFFLYLSIFMHFSLISRFKVNTQNIIGIERNLTSIWTQVGGFFIPRQMIEYGVEIFMSINFYFKVLLFWQLKYLRSKRYFIYSIVYMMEMEGIYYCFYLVVMLYINKIRIRT
jgi:hypothetical protein